MIKLLVFLVFIGSNGVTVASTPFGEYSTVGLCEQAIEEKVFPIWQPRQKRYFSLNVYPVCYKEGDFWK